MLKIPGYTVTQKLHEGAKSIVYRALETETQQPIVIKTTRQLYPSLKEVAKLRHQYNIVKDLKTAGIVKPYRLEKHENRLLLILEDFDGQAIHAEIELFKKDIIQFLEAAIQLAQHLDDLHQHHIIHKDIKPQNILINRQTNVIKFIDFGISSRLSRENQDLKNPGTLEGTLAFMSPEQTGRMNRSLDYRTDFYSLGATFYYLVTGILPFEANDPMELVHCHIAKQPIPADQHNSLIPAALSQILLKLLAKTAEERYQSAQGLAADLTRCLKELRQSGTVAPFKLGQADVCDRFEIPEKLYGRHLEVQSLLRAFDRVCEGTVELMLVSGFSGIGKSALIHEVQKPIVRQRGYFISGKFDQLQRNVPYASLIQAFQSLVQQILTESQDDILHWKHQLLKALGPNGQIIVDVIPEIELILGSQPPVPTLGPTESQNRFNSVFQRFVSVFTQRQHPLVLFLDDLQWADSASLKLLQSLVTAPEREYLFLIGAYRDHEVHAAHPLVTTLDEIRQAHTKITELQLQPLARKDVQQLLADTLNSALDDVDWLTSLMLAKTNGNPFFLAQLLNYLYEEGLLYFNHDRRVWQWDLAQIQAVDITDNVVDLMIVKLQRLSERSQHLLQLAACIGNEFDVQTLAIIAEQPLAQVAHDLQEAVQETFVVPSGTSYQLPDQLSEAEMQDWLRADPKAMVYRFLHDRVQQAAYALIPNVDRQTVHLKIGRLLLQNAQPQEQDSWIFQVVNHLNDGRSLLSDPHEKEKLAHLNLAAGRKAKASIAYEAAVQYLAAGMDVLYQNSWQKHYQLTFDLYRERFECEYLCGNFEQAEQLFQVLLKQAKTAVEKAEIYSIQIILYTTLGKFAEVIELGRQALDLLGWSVPKGKNQVQQAILAELFKIKLRLDRRKIADLINLPTLSDPRQLAQINVMAHVIPALYYTDMDLSNLFYLKMASLSLKYGNAPTSAVGYLGLGRFLGEKLNDFQGRYRFGKLALDLVEKFNSPELKCKTYFLFGGFINHWTQPSQNDLGYLKTAHQAGVDFGDLIWACYANNVLSMTYLALGTELSEVEVSTQTYLTYANQVGELYTPAFFQITYQATRCLQGYTADPCTLEEEHYDEAQQVAFLQSQPGLVGALNWYYVTKAAIFYIFDRYTDALDMALASEQTIGAAQGLARVVDHCFYYSLCLTALYAQTSPQEQRRYGKILKRHLKQLKLWAKEGASSHSHKYFLVAAEVARIQNQPIQAQSYYEQAIHAARTNGYVHHEAIANERIASFYQAKGNEVIARAYLMEARYAYLRWGAIAKVDTLDQQYPYLATQDIKTTEKLSSATATTASYASTSGDHTTDLDLYSVVKASQALSDEIILEKLISKMMQIIIENAGGQTGYLLFNQAGEWVAKAKASVEAGPSILPMISVDALLPTSIINYVARTAESLLLNDAVEEPRFNSDPYILKHQPKSIVCVPLIHQGKLVSIAYLENNLTTGAFNTERLEVLKILSAQAAISIENATLYTRQVELTNAYSRFIPPEYLQFLKKEITQVHLGDHVSREMAVMFSDIRSFTTLSESMTPQENFDFINAYLQQVGPKIRQHHGLIIKYLGDGVMAVFPNSVDDAVQAGIAQINAVRQYNQQRNSKGLIPIQIGIGLHVGNMMVGIVGEPSRLQADTVSDNINLTARLEGLTKFYGVSLLISEQVLEKVKDASQYQLRFLDRAVVQGRNEPISVYEVLDAEFEETRTLKLETQPDFEQGILLYRKQAFLEARACFEKVLTQNPFDKTALLYLDRLEILQHANLPENWDGVWRFTQK